MKTAIIGRGNVATHLCKALCGKAEVVKVNPHTLAELPEDADIIIISVSDDAIRDVALRIRTLLDGQDNRVNKSQSTEYNPTAPEPIIAHTSGSVGIEILEGCARQVGVFYPLQTFSKNVPLNYKDIPFFIEANSEECFSALSRLAHEISDHVFSADSEKRRRLHIAAVFACNFSNHLVNIADTLLHEQDMDYRVLLPLLKETVRKLESVSPADAQTGPAVRGDRKVINSHISALAATPELQNLYSTLSSSIISTHQKN